MVASHLNCGKSIRGDDVFGTFFDVLSLPRVLIVGDRTVRVQSHVVSQVLTIAHLYKGTGKDNWVFRHNCEDSPHFYGLIMRILLHFKAEF